MSTFKEEVWGQVQGQAVPCNYLGEGKGWERECPAQLSLAWGGGFRPENLTAQPPLFYWPFLHRISGKWPEVTYSFAVGTLAS